MRTVSLFILSGVLCLPLAGPVVRSQDPPKPVPQPAVPDAPAKVMTVTGPTEVSQYKLVRLKLNDAPPGYTVFWDVAPEELADVATQKVKSVFEFTAPPGVYRIKVRAFRGGGEDVAEARYEVTVKGTTPPVPPTPPGPTPPSPQPPQPAPAPIPAPGNRALIVYESADLSKYPPAQMNVLYAKEVREYLDRKCVLGSDGKTHDWRIWDKDADVSGESKVWQDAMKLQRDALPWLVVSTGTTGYSGPLPADVPSTLTLLKKYLGD